MPHQTIFEAGKMQLVAFESDLILCHNGRDWYYPTSYQDAVEKMIKSDWDATINAVVDLIKTQSVQS